MLDKEKWEYSKEEAKDLAQDYLDKQELIVLNIL